MLSPSLGTVRRFDWLFVQLFIYELPTDLGHRLPVTCTDEETDSSYNLNDNTTL